MWVFTQKGFVSIVQDRDGKGLWVRARDKQDLVALFPGESITHTPDADYSWRCLVSEDKAAEMMARQVYQIDYDNFKNRVYETQGAGRAQVYGDVWFVMVRFFQSIQPKGKPRKF